MKLYYSRGACSLAVRIIINELNLKCDYVAVDLKTHQYDTDKDFYQINPKGAVPTLETSDGILTENQVIQQYLADTNKANSLLPPVGDFKRYRVLEVLNFVSADIHKNFAPIFNSQYPDAVRNDIVKPLLVKKFAYIDSLVANKKFVMGDHFTLPDSYLFVVIRWAEKMKVGIENLTHLMAYYDRLKAHPSVVKSCEEEGLN